MLESSFGTVASTPLSSFAVAGADRSVAPSAATSIGQLERQGQGDGELRTFVMLGEMTENHMIAFGDEEGADESS